MRVLQAAPARTAIAALQQKTHVLSQEECGKRLGRQVLTSGILTVTNTLTFHRLSKTRPDHTSGVPTRRNPKLGLFTRSVTAIMGQRQRQADQHIARYIERHGDRITDAIEPDVQNYVLASGRRL